MKQIRLTCGECDKRYRLPASAAGYFRCRRCDLVMAIPENADISTDSDEDLESELLDEIGIDPSTNEPIHLSSSGLFPDSDLFESCPPSESVESRHYQGHIKRETGIGPGDVAMTAVGIGLALGGWLTIVLQLLKDVEFRPRSLVALVLGLLAAIIGIVLFSIGLRRARKIFVPAAVISGFISIVLFGVAVLPTDDGNDQMAGASSNKEDHFFDPGQSQFGVDKLREKARKRQARLDGIKARIDSVRKDRDEERVAHERVVNNIPPSPFDNGNGDDNTDVPETENGSADAATMSGLNMQATATGKLAIEIDRLWTSVRPWKRKDLVDDMKQVVESGLDQADEDEQTYWKMYEDRLSSLQRFSKGEWITLEFQHGLTGWHVSNPANLFVESSETVKIQPLHADSNSAILSSADMFYGPITVKVKLRLAGGSSASQLGLVFSSGTLNDSIGAEDCVVLFDPDFSRMRSGAFGSRSPAESLSGLSPRIDSDSPIDVQINVCRGFVQVFANKQLLVEKFDKRIQDIHTVQLAALGESGRAGSFSIGDWQVRRWKSGRPPGKDAFVEEDLMYLQSAVEEFPEIGWYYCRLAFARFGTGKFRRAAETARKAEALGIPHEQLAIIYAMDLELDRKYAQAVSEYSSTAPGFGDDMAKAWQAWLVLTNSDSVIRSSGIDRSITDDFFPDRWVVNRVKAAVAASDGQYSVAAKMIEKISKEVPMIYRGETSRQLAAYKSGRPYFRSRGTIPFYHGLKVRAQPVKRHYDSD